MKINKACDLSSISVLPPQSRRSITVNSGLESSFAFGRSRSVSDLRPQQQKSQYSQQSSQGISSQPGLFSQYSQNSQDDILTNERISSQERENSMKRTSYLPQVNHSREESQMTIPRCSSSLVRKWSSQEYKCQISEELEHRIGTVETSINRLGMILDSVQSDLVQVNKGNKEVALEIEGMRQKFNVIDDSVKSLVKGQEDIKTRIDLGLTTVSDKLEQNNINQEFYTKIFSMLSALSERIDIQTTKLQNDLCKNFSKEIQALSLSMKNSKQRQTSPIHDSKIISGCFRSAKVLPISATMQSKIECASQLPKDEIGGWTSIKNKPATSKVGNLVKKINQDQEQRIIIESDEEIDRGFSFLLKEEGTEKDVYSFEDAQEETSRILRRARRRKRKFSNTIIIN